MRVEISDNQIWLYFQFFKMVKSAVADNKKVVRPKIFPDFPVVRDFCRADYNTTFHVFFVPKSVRKDAEKSKERISDSSLIFFKLRKKSQNKNYSEESVFSEETLSFSPEDFSSAETLSS